MKVTIKHDYVSGASSAGVTTRSTMGFDNPHVKQSIERLFALNAKEQLGGVEVTEQGITAIVIRRQP